MIKRAEYRFILSFAFILTFDLIAAQEPKPPEAVDDVAVTIQQGLVTIKVLLNDISEDGHPVKVVAAVGSPDGDVQFTDSTVTYIPHTKTVFNVPGSDTVRYMIKDLVNGLMSGFGKIGISLLPLDFNLSGDTLFLDGLRANFNANGSWFHDYSGGGGPGFEVPLNSGLTTLKRSNLLIGGRRNGIVEHVACEHDYTGIPWLPARHASDFWPGPLSFDHVYSLEYDSSWNRTWKLTREMVQWHREQWTDPGYQVSESIFTWPGNGGPGKGQSQVLAPFQDVNGNGQYDPLLGDYPAVPGDQAIYSMYNDRRTVAVATMSSPVGVEVHQIAYAFDCPGDSVFKNSVFVRYRIINRSEYDYTDLFCGIYTAFCIGNEGDEYMGCDTLLDSYFGYNDVLDEPVDSVPGYGEAPPSQGIVFLNHDLHGFIGPQKPGWTGPGFYYELLRALWAPDGEPITFGGDGHGGTDTTTFLFPGDPLDPQQWSDYQVNQEEPGIRNGIGAAGPFDFPPGDTVELDIAYVFARDYGGTNLSSVQLLKERIATLRWYYDNDSTPCGTPWTSAAEYESPVRRLYVSPNPARNEITLSGMEEGEICSCRVFDARGIMVAERQVRSGQKVDISSLSPGLYIIGLYNLEEAFTTKFIKID